MTTLAVTLGDPAGIGPEVVEAALRTLMAAPKPPAHVRVFGPRNVVTPLLARLAAGPAVQACELPEFAGPVGCASAQSGRAALDALQAAISEAQAGGIDALVTAPISKQALHLAGSQEFGHTEILARTLGAGPVAMAFFAEGLKVVLATVHVPLRDIFARITPQRVFDVARLMHEALHERLGIAQPRLALAGLNPHASEHGLFGDEEARILAPAAERCRAAGIALSAPISPDTVFGRAVAGEFDAVVALYHDQGLIPIKLLSFGAATNVTLGLRVLRTSPDHGTAYDRVGRGTARADGMLAALQAAIRLAPVARPPARDAR